MGGTHGQDHLIQAKAVYYGWPSQVNNAYGNLPVAAVTFGQYDVVVFNGGLEESGHGDHASTVKIINSSTKATRPGSSAIWMRRTGVRNGVQMGGTPVDWETHLDMWLAAGVDGIFVDRFSYDWNVTRAMQNQILDAIHGRDLPAFVNGWFVDNVFSRESDPAYPRANPAAPLQPHARHRPVSSRVLRDHGGPVRRVLSVLR